VALLRGINVGGRHMLPMPALASMFVEAGAADVRTYMQSGNVVFSASRAIAQRIPRVISQQVLQRFGFEPHVIMRTGTDIARIAADHPFLTRGADMRTLHVGFLDEAPHARLIAALDPERSPGDRFAVRGSEIYLHLRNGAGKSKLTYAHFEKTVKTWATFRNWRTVLTLAEMMCGTDQQRALRR